MLTTVSSSFTELREVWTAIYLWLAMVMYVWWRGNFLEYKAMTEIDRAYYL